MIVKIQSFVQKAIVLAILTLCSLFLAAQEMLPLPKFNYIEKNMPRAKLVLVKEISSDFDSDLFFAVPKSICAGENGVFFVYDSKLMKIFIFDRFYQCIGTCLEKGAGPAEVLPKNNIEINAGLDGNLYTCDTYGDKIIQFSAATGKYKKDFKLRRIHITQSPFRPVVDKLGCFYVFSVNNGIVDKLDQNFKNVLHTYLDLNVNKKFLVFKPSFHPFLMRGNPPRWVLPDFFNTMCDVTNEGQLFIFSFRSATAFLFDKNNKLLKQFNIYIDRVLLAYKKDMEEMIETENKNSPGKINTLQSQIFLNCFLDRDEPYFYLQLNGAGMVLYKFALTGKLVRVITRAGENGSINATIQAKKNGLFYGLSIKEGNPMIFKEKYD